MNKVYGPASFSSASRWSRSMTLSQTQCCSWSHGPSDKLVPHSTQSFAGASRCVLLRTQLRTTRNRKLTRVEVSLSQSEEKRCCWKESSALPWSHVGIIHPLEVPICIFLTQSNPGTTLKSANKLLFPIVIVYVVMKLTECTQRTHTHTPTQSLAHTHTFYMLYFILHYKSLKDLTH